MSLWSERDAKIIEALKEPGSTYRSVADDFGVTIHIVRNAIKFASKARERGEGAALAILAPDPTDREGFAARIAATWRESFLAVMETCRLIAAAKEALPHGEFEAMVDSDLPFTPSTARRLMIIAGDSRLSDRAHVHALPPSWGTLYELTKLDDVTFREKVADGTIRPDMERRDIEQTRKVTARAVKEELLGREIAALPDRKFGVILADPEWRFEPWSRKTGMDRSADNHYPTSATEVIASRPVADIAADRCILFLWATVPMLPHALAVMGAWGFDYRSHFIWAKDRIGTGYWNRNRHELLLVGVKGDIPAPAMGTQWESLIEAPVGAHSAKPEKFLELIEAYFPTLPKIELNRRGPARPGWTPWGNEAEPPTIDGEACDPTTGEIVDTPEKLAEYTKKTGPAFALSAEPVEDYRLPTRVDEQEWIDAPPSTEIAPFGPDPHSGVPEASNPVAEPRGDEGSATLHSPPPPPPQQDGKKSGTLSDAWPELPAWMRRENTAA